MPHPSYCSVGIALVLYPAQVGPLNVRPLSSDVAFHVGRAGSYALRDDKGEWEAARQHARITQGRESLAFPEPVAPGRRNEGTLG